MADKKDWFRLKKYPHIGRPLSLQDRGWVERYVKDPSKVQSHSFYPFIHRNISSRKFRRPSDGLHKISNKRVVGYKSREVYYAGHLDAMIYSYYASILNEAYEDKLVESGLTDCVTAYRRIKVIENNPESRYKCNIDFANDLFNYIRNCDSPRLCAIALDVTSFFDNLSHSYLRLAWKHILGDLDTLPKDHYNVYRNITKFSYIDIEDIFKEFQHDILIKSEKGEVHKSKIDKIELLKKKGAIAFCEPDEFHSRIRAKGLIKSNKYTDKSMSQLRSKGIPQGSPISSVLANLYMLNFDCAIQDIVKIKKGIYRRYCDDIVVVIDEEYRDELIDCINSEIAKVNLDINPSKTQVFVFEASTSGKQCKEYDIKTKSYASKKMFEYLGFAFDGNNVYLKSSSLAKFYRKMKRTIKRGTFYAKHGKNRKPELFKGRLYKRFTIKGAKRRRVYRKSPHGDFWIKTDMYDWGNFLSYGYMASRIIDNNKIKGQLKNHWRKFHDFMKSREAIIQDYYNKNPDLFK